MKWEPTDCKTGDMVRIRLGSIYHYGVFLSEDEVVQFGYPPIPEFSEQNAVVTVVAVDIDTFSRKRKSACLRKRPLRSRARGSARAATT